jgi:hypothetical protein
VEANESWLYLKRLNGKTFFLPVTHQ